MKKVPIFIFILCSSFAFCEASLAQMLACIPAGGFMLNPQQAKPLSATEIELPSKEKLFLPGVRVPAEVSSLARHRMQDFLSAQNGRYVPFSKSPDRYGRIPVFLMVGSELAQALLVREGFAVVEPTLLEACLDELLMLERQSRHEKLGIWSNRSAFMLSSDFEGRKQAAGQFKIHEGVLLNSGERRYATFLNFGKNWQQDFTAILSTTVAEKLKLRHNLAALKEQKIRVRGVVEPKPPYRMRIERAEAVEVLDGSVSNE